MAVVLSLLVILPALAENTDGQATQGRLQSDELIVGVFADAADAQDKAAGVAPDALTLALRSDMLGPDLSLATDDADPRDTFFNGKLYVSNQDDAFSTVLVTHLVDAPNGDGTFDCASVVVRNENTGERITLQLVPSTLSGTPLNTRYYQNYFKVVDRDGENQVDKYDGLLACPGEGEADEGLVPSTTSIPTDDVDDSGTPDVDESLARINASDGDMLTIRAGTHVQQIYVDGEAPTFSEVTPADGARFKSATLSIGFEVRDDGSGLRHDDEYVMSTDGDPVSHDAATVTNTDATDNTDPRVGDGDGITDREPISERNGGSADIDVTFYTPDQIMAEVALPNLRSILVAAQTTATDARQDADDAEGNATTAATAATDAATAATTAATAAAAVPDTAAETALNIAASALTTAAGVLGSASATAPTSTQADAATAAASAATTAAGVSGTDADAAQALTVAAAALTVAATAITAAIQVIPLDDAADMAEDAVQNAQDNVTDAELAAAGTAIDDHGSSGWTLVERGVAYEANIVYNITTQGTEVLEYEWVASARDRVGNEGEANSKKRFDLTIDTDKPQVSEARTGISYDVGKNREVRDRSYIALTFINGVTNDEDPIATETLDVRDFIVEGYEVVDIIHPELIDDDDQEVVAIAIGDSAFDEVSKRDPRSRVYLELDAELGSAETPRVSILGGAVTDLAGNQNTPPQRLLTEDKIPAGLTITVTSSDSSSGRTVATEDGTFTVTVDSDEPLRRTPRLYFARFEVMTTDDQNTGVNAVGTDGTFARLTLNDDIKVSPEGSLAPVLDVVEQGLAWTQDYDAEDLDSTTNILAVLVWSEDTAGNAGSSSGWTNKAGDGVLDSAADTLDLVALDEARLLIEIDRGLEAATPEVLPSADGDLLVTESMNPYMQLTFSESAENSADITFVSLTGSDVEATFKSVKDGTDTVDLDAHKTVTLTAVTLDGEDVSALVGPGLSTTEDRFTIALRGLAAGEHTLTYSAEDEAGNSVTDEEVDFEVQAHAAYEIAIRPGWNLISLPGTPVDNSIGDVMGADLDSAIVLGYQNGAWVSAIRNDANEWQGTLGEIVGGYGYWVQTTAYETISAVIPSIDPTNVLPTVPVIAGWNLLGVVDVSQGAQDSEPIGKEEADDYFVSIDWRVGYYFRNEANDWQKIVPDAEPSDGEAEILNGKGYWVWSVRAGKLVP